MSQDTQSSQSQDPDHRIIYLLWVVVAVLAIGSIVGGFLLIHKASDLGQSNATLNNDVSTLRSQLQQARSAATPAATPSDTPVPTVSSGN